MGIQCQEIDVVSGRAPQVEGSVGTVDFKERHISLRWSVVPGSEQSFERVLIAIEDITERKAAEEALQAALREKEIMLKEIHHRFKNNLQIVSSLLNLQSRYVENDKVLEAITESRVRVRSMALIHEKLYQTKNFSEIDFADYARDLSSEIFRAYNVCPVNVKLPIDQAESLAKDSPPVPVDGFAAIQSHLQYPALALAGGIEGRVIVTALISEQGKVRQTKILASVHTALDAAAVKAVKSVLWKPAIKDGQPVSASITIPVAFQAPAKGAQGSVPSALPKPADEPPTFVAYDKPPRPLGGFKPIQEALRYPAIARKAGIEGRVIVQLKVSTDGGIAETRVLKSLGHSGCDQAAIAAIENIAWKPALSDGKPVTVWVAIPVIFKLD